MVHHDPQPEGFCTEPGYMLFELIAQEAQNRLGQIRSTFEQANIYYARLREAFLAEMPRGYNPSKQLRPGYRLTVPSPHYVLEGELFEEEQVRQEIWRVFGRPTIKERYHNIWRTVQNAPPFSMKTLGKLHYQLTEPVPLVYKSTLFGNGVPAWNQEASCDPDEPVQVKGFTEETIGVVQGDEQVTIQRAKDQTTAETLYVLCLFWRHQLVGKVIVLYSYEPRKIIIDGDPELVDYSQRFISTAHASFNTK